LLPDRSGSFSGLCLFATSKLPLDFTPVAGIKSPRMENIINLVGEYWPHLLGLLFFAVVAFNARSWFKERRAQG